MLAHAWVLPWPAASTQRSACVDSRLLAFIGVAALLTISPGPDMALVLRNALRSGTGTAILTAAGTVTGVLAWGIASSIGIAAVLATSAALFEALKLAGAAYLVALGVAALLASRQHRHAVTATETTAALASRAAAFRQGLLTNLLNPKVGVFYTTFLPQFMIPGQPVLARSLLLAAIHAGMSLAWLSAYAYAATRAGDLLRTRRTRVWLERATGAILIGFGLRLAADVR